MLKSKFLINKFTAYLIKNTLYTKYKYLKSHGIDAASLSMSNRYYQCEDTTSKL